MMAFAASIISAASKESNSSVDEGIHFNEGYGILISNVCKTVKLFRKSPLISPIILFKTFIELI